MNSQFVRELYEKYNDELAIFIKSILYSHNPHDVADCLQNLYLTVLEAEELDNHENIRGWLFITAKNFAHRINTVYLEEKNKKVELTERMRTTKGVEDSIIEKLEYIRMTDDGYAEKAIETLTFNEETLYRLKYKQKLNVKELSEKLGIKENTVYVRDFRLRAKIEKFLNDL